MNGDGGASERQAGVLRLTYLQGLTHDEAATTLGRTPAEVRNDVHRGMQRLRRALRSLVQEYCSSLEEFEQELGILKESLK